MLGFDRSTPNLESLIPAAPPPKRHPYDQWSPDARALDLVGDKWTLLIIRDLAAGPRRFVELQRVLPGISTEQLRSRLNRMVADGLLTRQRYREVPPRVDYELTERSRELMPVLGALAQWGYDWTWTAPRPGEDINVGAIFRLAPGLLEPPPGLEGAVELVVDADGEAPERRFLVTMSNGSVEIAERERNGTRPPPCAAASRRGCARSAPRATSRSSRSTATAASPTGCSPASPTRPRAAAHKPPLSASSALLARAVVGGLDVREGALEALPEVLLVGDAAARVALARRDLAAGRLAVVVGEDARALEVAEQPERRQVGVAAVGASGAWDRSPGSRRRPGRAGAGSGRRRRSSTAPCRRVPPRRW